MIYTSIHFLHHSWMQEMNILIWDFIENDSKHPKGYSAKWIF